MSTECISIGRTNGARNQTFFRLVGWSVNWQHQMLIHLCVHLWLMRLNRAPHAVKNKWHKWPLRQFWLVNQNVFIMFGLQWSTCKVKVYRNCIVNDFRKGFTDIEWNSHPVHFLALSLSLDLPPSLPLAHAPFSMPCIDFLVFVHIIRRCHVMALPSNSFTINPNASIILTRWPASGTVWTVHDDHAALPNALKILVCLIFSIVNANCYANYIHGSR